jgi:2-methylcitrate dehydratase PrpD
VTAERLARAVARTSWPNAPDPVRDRVVDLVADCVAVSALGSGRQELRSLLTELTRSTPEGTSSVIGSSRGWPATTAAFLNASAGAADQLQDGHRLARGHPASHVVPAVLAVAEERDLPGHEALSAVLAGYEAGVRVGRAMGGTPDGMHDIGTWGQVAVSAGIARLLRPGDAGTAQRAVELSASALLTTDAGTVFGGRSGSHVFLGASVQLGTTLALAAVSGLEPLPGALDRHLAKVAARRWQPAELAQGIADDGSWAEFEVLHGYVKRHPTCAHLHGVNDAVDELIARGVVADDVRDVEVRVFAGAAGFDEVADGELAARFSVPTSVAVALVTGGLDPVGFDDATVTAPDVVALAKRVRVVHDPALDDGYPAGRPARVVVTRRDGTTASASCDRPRGDDDRAFSREELRDKALRLLSHRFGGVRGRAVLQALQGLGSATSARELGDVIRSGAKEPM